MLRPGLAVLQDHHRVFRVGGREEACEPEVHFFFPAGCELAGLSGAGLAGGVHKEGGGLPAGALGHHPGQQLLQAAGGGGRKRLPRRRRGIALQDGPGGLVQGVQHKGGGAVDAVRRDGVHHGGHLQRGGQQLPLSKAEVGQLARRRQGLGFGQDPCRPLQRACHPHPLPKTQPAGGFQHRFGPQLLAQADEIAVAAFFQGGGQVHRAVGGARGAAEHLPVHHRVARALHRQAVQAGFQGCGGQHRLEHRPHRIGGQGAVQQGAARLIQAGGDVVGVVAGQADAGPHLGGVHVQHQDAARSHGLGGYRLRRPLDGAGDGQLHPRPVKGGGGIDRLGAFHQPALAGDGAGDGVLAAAAGQHRVQSGLQPGHPAALAVQIADQVLAERDGAVAPGCRVGVHPQPADVPADLQQERGGGVPPLVQRGLAGGAGGVVEADVAVLPGQAEGVPGLFQAGEGQAAAIVKAAPPGRQPQGDGALVRGTGRVAGVAGRQIQPAQHHRKPRQQRRIHGGQPAHLHGQAPSPTFWRKCAHRGGVLYSGAGGFRVGPSGRGRARCSRRTWRGRLRGGGRSNGHSGTFSAPPPRTYPKC